MLSITGLTFRYGESAVLRGVDLTVALGAVVCLIGPNGAGKSTLLKCINGILRPAAGRILVEGQPVETFGRQALARFAAYVPQQTGSSLALQVYDMVALGRAPHRGRSSKAQDRAIVCEAIERLRLEPIAFRPFGALSGGQRQRVLVARALAQQGRLMLMDEPTSNLDPYYQVETVSLIRAIAKERRIAALVAIHDLSLAARLADTMVLMHDGTVMAEGRWQDVLTAEHLVASFGVGAVVGQHDGIPYVLPVDGPPAAPRRTD